MSDLRDGQDSGLTELAGLAGTTGTPVFIPGLPLPPYRKRLAAALQELRSMEIVMPEAVTFMACRHVVEGNELRDLYRTVAQERKMFSRQTWR